MKKLTLLAAGLLLLIPSLGFSDSFTVRAGYYLPRMMTASYLAEHSNNLFAIEFQNMSFLPKDYRGSIIGAEYDYFLNKYVSLALGLDSFNRSEVGFYRDWVANSFDNGDFAFPFQDFLGDDIIHSLRLSYTPLQLSLKFLPLGRRARIAPYVGGGGTLAFWGVRMFGDQVDFNPVDELGNPVQYFFDDPVLGEVEVFPVVPLAARESGVSLGWHAMGGIEVPVGYRVTVSAEARYHSVRAELHKLFEGFDTLELGGWAFSAGLSFWF